MKLRGNTNHRLRTRRRGSSYVVRVAAEVAEALRTKTIAEKLRIWFTDNLTAGFNRTAESFKALAEATGKMVVHMTPPKPAEYIVIKGTITDAPASQHEEA